MPARIAWPPAQPWWRWGWCWWASPFCSEAEMKHGIAAALSVLLATSNALGGSARAPVEQTLESTEDTGWSYSSSVTTYIAEHDREYASPTISADLNSLH